MSDVSESLRSLTKNEQPWAIRSGRSEEMSDHERIAQGAYQKWANEWIAHFLEHIAHSLIFGQNRWANSQPWFLHMYCKSRLQYIDILFLFLLYNSLQYSIYCVQLYIQTTVSKNIPKILFGVYESSWL